MSAPQLESPISTDAPPLISPSTSAAVAALGEPLTSPSLGLRITVDLSEMSTASNQQDDYIVSRLLADDEPEEELLTAEEKAAADDDGLKSNNKAPEVRFVDKTGIFIPKERQTKNVIVTRDRRYVNRSAAAFVIGIDRSTDEWKQRRATRGSRFGTDNPVDDDIMVSTEFATEMVSVEDFDVSALYESVGLTPEVLTKEADNLRLTAIHLRGLDDLSTDDVLEHFGAFNPAFLEWVDDTSCNVVWQEEIEAARALFSLSKPIEETGEEEDETKEVAADKIEDAPAEAITEDVAETAQMDVVELAPAQQPLEAKEFDEKIAVDQDVVEQEGHLSEGEVEEDDAENVLKTLGVGKMYADREPGETSSAASDEEDLFGGSGPKRKKSADQTAEKEAEQRTVKSLKWRRGLWKGNGLKERPLFMRFATIFDKKQVGANKYSKYYEKYGNPNFNNMPGLISTSMRKRMAGSRRRQQLEEARAALEVLGGSHRDTDAAIGELAAMGAGTAVGEEEEIEVAEVPKRNNNRPLGDLRTSGWTTRKPRDGGKPFTLSRTEDDDESAVERQAGRGRVGSSEGRCPPPSPRNQGHNRDDVSGDEWISGDASGGSDTDEYSSDDEDPVKKLLSEIPARGRGSTRTKMHADDEERKRLRRSGEFTKMRSDGMRRSRSRSRSPLGAPTVRPARNFFGDGSQRSRSLRDRLGPAVGGDRSFHSTGGRNDRDRGRHGRRQREDLRSRLG